MKIKISNKTFPLLLLLCYITNSCTETYALQTDTYEEVLVVEATITNELKKQEIKISKTARFEDKGITIETGANVIIKDDLGTEYNFTEQSGIYISQTEFNAVPNREYYLEITTKEGKKYKSSTETLTTETPIESVIPSVVVDKNQGRGVQINVRSYDPKSTSKYYRYEYEETYKIVAPKWAPVKATLVDYQIIVGPNSTDTRICYSSKKSDAIILVSTANQNEDRVALPIRFISDQDYIITSRYSIFVKQYVENLEAYTFHKTMKEIASSSSILSPKQPGLVNGNLKCITNADEKVIGFFDVTAVSSKRIYFNYDELFPAEALPPYVINCDQFCYGGLGSNCAREDGLFDDIILNKLALNFFSEYYYWVERPCGDCTAFSSNIKPTFWLD